MNPYETPKAEAPDDLSGSQSSWASKERIKEFFSLSGSFSRMELLIATLLLLGLEFLFSLLNALIPGIFTNGVHLMATIALYPVWGAALGKRSRDLGTTFTYGMIVGMILPFIIGLIFLFQGGNKSRAAR